MGRKGTSTESVRKWRAEHPKEARAGDTAWRLTRTRFLREYKSARGCVDCGYNDHPAALDFDHLPGSVKEFGIASKGAHVSLGRLVAEIEKCEVVCANCHRIRTFARKDQG